MPNKNVETDRMVETLAEMILEHRGLTAMCHTVAMNSLKDHGVSELPENDSGIEHRLYWSEYSATMTSLMSQVMVKLERYVNDEEATKLR